NDFIGNKQRTQRIQSRAWRLSLVEKKRVISILRTAFAGGLNFPTGANTSSAASAKNATPSTASKKPSTARALSRSFGAKSALPHRPFAASASPSINTRVPTPYANRAEAGKIV